MLTGMFYVADGEIFVYDKSGKEQRRIQIEERPIFLGNWWKAEGYAFCYHLKFFLWN